MFRRSPRTLVSGLGVATAVLAGVLIAISFGSGMIGFDAPAGKSEAGPSAAVMIEGSRAPVRTGARPRASRREAAAPSFRQTSRARTAAPARAPIPNAGAKKPADPAALPAPPRPAAQSPPRPPPPAPAAAPEPRAATARARAPLQPLGNGVDHATENLAKRLRKLTRRVGEGAKALSPPLGGVVQKTGDALGDVVENTGNGLGRLLDARPR